MSFKQEMGKCSECDCGTQRLIVNRTHNLCEEKNSKRLERNSSNSLSKVKVSKSVMGIRAQSKKRMKIEAEYIAIKKEIRDEMEGILQCEECGTSNNSSFSHLVPRSRREDLISNRRNIVVQCMDSDIKKGCHTRWEENDSTMNTYQKNMESVKLLDQEYYNLLLMKNE